MTLKTVAVMTFSAGVKTVILPVVALTGTLILIMVAVSLVMVAVTPWTVTFVAPVRSAPLITTVVPTGPEAGAKPAMAGFHAEKTT